LIIFLFRNSGNAPGKLFSLITFLCHRNNAVAVVVQLGSHIMSAIEAQMGGKAIPLGLLCKPQDLIWR